MKSRHKVGIIIPAYNCERYIEDCLHSALDQDVDNLRIYVVDDRSTDSTPDVIERVARAFPGCIERKSNSQNQGKSMTRQAATEMAIDDRCDFIAPLDADDIRKPNSLGCQLVALVNAPTAAVCYARTDIINAKGELHSSPRWEQMVAFLKGMPEGEVWSQIISRGKLGTMDTIVIRSEAARRCRYDPCFRYFEDVDYLAQLATARENSQFIAVNKIVASYRFHAQQSSDIIEDVIRKGDLPRLKNETMHAIALRIFHRLELQGRPVPRRKRRLLWRLLIGRLALSSLRSEGSRDFGARLGDVMTPIRRLEYDTSLSLSMPWDVSDDLVSREKDAN